MFRTLVTCGLLLAAGSAAFPTRAEHSLVRQGLHAGGTTQSSGAGYELAGTLGQAAPGPAAGGDHQLDGGFLWPLGERTEALFQNGFEDV
jgi:hypothetical protein